MNANEMLWYKSWLETRWRFVIGLALLMCSAASAVLLYPKVMQLVPLANSLDVSGEVGRRIRESAAVVSQYRGYVWSEWYRQDLARWWTLFAVLLGTGGLLSQASGGGALFTLSMPVSRNRLLGIRAATGLVELLVLAIVPSLVVPLLSPAIGKSYAIGDALIHGACMFLAGAVFFSLAFLLSTMFSDLWTPLLLALAAAIILGLCEQVSRGLGIFSVMSGEQYFRSGSLPWLGLLASAGLSAGMLYGATRSIAQRDF